MASVVEICNFALQELGANYISSLNENSPESRECNLRYDSVRRSLLRMHHWNFAIKRVALSRETTTPAFNYSYQYALPSDFLKIIMTSTEELYQSDFGVVKNSEFYVGNPVGNNYIDKYKLENKKLLSNDSSVSIIYVADITDTGQFDSTFTELLQRLLCAKITKKLTGSQSEANDKLALFEKEFENFANIDSQEGSIDIINTSSYLSARL